MPPSGWERLFPARIRRRSVAREVDSEIAFHLEMRVQEFVERGMTPELARLEALRRMGDVDRVRGVCRELGEARERDMQRAEWFQEIVQDLRFAARQVLRTPSLTLVAVLTLALGIGATTAIFSVVDAVVLRPLPFDAPERILRLRSGTTSGFSAVSYANFADWRAQATGAGRAFERMAAAVSTGITLTGRDLPVLLRGGRVTPDYFSVFGIRPQLGRGFVEGEDVLGRPHVAVLSDGAWRKYFDADPRIVGREIPLDGAPHTVVGVMPASFDYLEESPEIWVPVRLTAEEATRRGASNLDVYGRVRPGTSLERAQATMDAIAKRLAEQFPEANRNAVVIQVRPFAEELFGDHRTRLLTLLGAVGFVLLIGCANVANLLLARGAVRQRELAVRAALGAGRSRLVRQLFTESIVLGLLGGTAGVLLAVLGVRALVALAPDDVPRLQQAAVDGRVLLFALALSVVSSIVFGLVPALRSARSDLQGTLREGGRGSIAGRRDRLRSGLVMAEVALALVLLSGGALLARSALLLQRVEPGFDPDGVITARIMLPANSYTPERVSPTFARIHEEARAVPGVAAAGLVLMVPLDESNANASVSAEGQPFVPDQRLPIEFRFSTGGYLAAMGIPLVAGRDFTDRDVETSPRVAIINETLAKKLWPSEEAVGKRITGLTASEKDLQLTEVVGVTRDTRHLLGKEVGPQVFYPVSQTPPAIWPLVQRSLVLVARDAAGSENGLALERPLREAVARVDPSLPLSEPRGMTEYMRRALATSRFTSMLLGMLSAIGLVLAAVGIYGIVTYFVTQRVPEIGVRVALGATPRDIVGLVVNSGLRPVILGVVVGVALSIASTRVLAGLLYGVEPGDPWTVAGVVVLLLVTSLAASLVPARRALRIDPATVMRE